MDHTTYIRRETGVSIVINSVLSALFFWLVFGGVDPVLVWGMGNWVFDFLPQSFMIALMSTLVPGALTAKAIRAGKIAGNGPRNWLPANLLARAVVLAILSAAGGTALVALLVIAVGVTLSLPWSITELSATTALALKVIYGAILALIVTPPGLRQALANQG